MPRITKGTPRYLYLQRSRVEDRLEDRLHLIHDPIPKKYSASDNPCRYRVSPIFPVLPSGNVDPDLTKDIFVGFYFYDRAFFVLGRLISLLEKEYRKNLWFSHGLASIIIFSSNISNLNEFSIKYSDGLRAFECWGINNNIITSRNHKYFHLPSGSPKLIKISDFSELSFDIKVTLFELVHCLNTAIDRANRFIPSLLLTLDKIIEYINEIIDDLLFLENPKRTKPKSLPSDIDKIIDKNQSERQKRIHQRTGQLVQLNSQLSYVISQAFSGMPPILENECQIRSYSLLGVGSAYLAVAGFTSHIERVFEKFPIDNVIENKYSIAPGVVLSAERLGLFNPDIWASYRDTADKWLKDMPAESFKPKLVSFSGRQGFRETETAVTVALPVLSAADTARWSLMTISHEMMHGHVRALLSAIFKDPQGKALTHVFLDYYEAFKNNQQYNANKEQKGWKQPNTLVESLRFMIVNYCCHKEGLFEVGVKQSQGKQPFMPPIFNNFKDIFAAFYREIHEIITHVLDYNYFYDCRDDLYLNLLWSSWTPVPAVLENMERYVLRSIITVASKETGITSDQFNLSVRIVKEALVAIVKRNPNNWVVREAIKILENDSIVNNFYPEFTAGLYLAKMTKYFLVSSQIYNELNKDDNRYLDEGYYKYRLNSGAFSGVTIESPVAFIADRLRRVIKQERQSLSIEYLSCWLFLTCASCYSEGGQNNGT